MIEDRIEWKSVTGYEGLYEVSDSGLVRGIDRYAQLPDGKKRFAKGRELKLGITNRGYVDVRLNKNAVSKSHLVHRLVAEAFLPNPERYPMINHLSGDKKDNRTENLQWTDARGNALHAYETGLNSNKGSSHNFAVPVIDTRTGQVFGTFKEFCAYLGVNYSKGRTVLNGHQPYIKSSDVTVDRYTKYSC